MAIFQVVFLLLERILAARLFQFSNISLSPTDQQKGGGNAISKEQDLDSELAAAGSMH